MSCPARSRGGKAGQSTRTARPPSSLRPSPASAAPWARATASGSGSPAGPVAVGPPGNWVLTVAPVPLGTAPWDATDTIALRLGEGVTPCVLPFTIPAAQLTAHGWHRHPGCVTEHDVAGAATYQSAERALALLSSFDDA